MDPTLITGLSKPEIMVVSIWTGFNLISNTILTLWMIIWVFKKINGKLHG